MLNGIDVSNYQGKFNWAARSPKPAFGFAKASEGLMFADADFTWNFQQMAKLGILRGAYHFGHPDEDPQRQAEYFVTCVDQAGKLATSDVLALDLEDAYGLSPSQTATWAVKFCDEVQLLTHKNPWLYTDHSFIKGGYCGGLEHRPLWIASPGTAGAPGDVSPWPVWSCHQYAMSGTDTDVFNGDAKAWAALANVAAPAAPVPPVKTPTPVKPTIVSVTVRYADGTTKSL